MTHDRKTADELFDAKYITSDNGCWLWHAYTDKDGYGVFASSGHTWNVRAHRYSYERTNGPIPDGLVIDHLCRVRACVNPDHLEVVTTQENTLRGIENGNHTGGKSHCPQGHEYTSENTYVPPPTAKQKFQRQCVTCRDEYYARNRAELLEYKREWFLRNRDKINARRRAAKRVK